MLRSLVCWVFVLALFSQSLALAQSSGVELTSHSTGLDQHSTNCHPKKGLPVEEGNDPNVADLGCYQACASTPYHMIPVSLDLLSLTESPPEAVLPDEALKSKRPRPKHRPPKIS
jgi:hypothetical protein